MPYRMIFLFGGANLVIFSEFFEFLACNFVLFYLCGRINK